MRAVPVLVLALFASTPSAAAECNRHEDKHSAAIGRALKPGTKLFVEGRYPAALVKRVRFPDAGKERLKLFKRVRINDAFEPDLRSSWVAQSELRFMNLAPLAGCKPRGPTKIELRRVPKSPRVADVVIAGTCRDGVGAGRVASPLHALLLTGTKLPFCVPLNEKVFDPLAPRDARVAPWERTRALYVAARLPRAPERRVELRVKVTVFDHADPRCNVCEPPADVDCTTETRATTHERTIPLPFDDGHFAKVPLFELDGLDPATAEHVEIDAALWTSGEDLARTRQEIYWPRCR